MATISGEVRDENGDLLADCVVRAYRRDTGALLVEGLTGDGSPEESGDADYASVSLLLHCDGTDGATTFTDSSGTPKTVTVNGNAHIETDQSKFGTAAAYFDGTGDYLALPNDAALNNFGTGDFTLDGWLYVTNISTPRMILCCFSTWTSAVAYALSVLNTGALRFMAGNSAAINITSSAGAISINTWYHWAVNRASGTTKLFLEGTSQGTPHSGSVTISNSSVPRIGMGSDNSDPFIGYLDEIRITKGVARYTNDFTPPTAAFLDNAYAAARPLGEYTLTTAYTDEVQVLALDPAGGTTFNDMILRTTPV